MKIEQTINGKTETIENVPMTLKFFNDNGDEDFSITMTPPVLYQIINEFHSKRTPITSAYR